MILPVILIGMQVAITVQNAVPTLDVGPSCRAASDGSLGLKQNLDSCLKAEQDARTQIVKEWSEFTAGDRSTCVGLSTISAQATYTELLTCLELMRDARKLPKDAEISPLGRPGR
jgi:hypothetical protein